MFFTACSSNGFENSSPSPEGGECAGIAVTDNGYNIADDNTCDFTASDSINDSITIDPGPLANNGGPTETIALLPGSSAIGVIPNPTSGLCPGTDQRGDPRPGLGETMCDIGAYEFHGSTTIASPTLTTTPSPNMVTLGPTSTTLKDSATLSGGSAPTGTITFKLYNPSSTLVDTEAVTVDGNGSYTTPTGYTIPSTGTVAGTYQWDASCSGDNNNAAVSDDNKPKEQVTVSKGSSSLSTNSTTSLGFGQEDVEEFITFYATLTTGRVGVPGQTITFTQKGPGGRSCIGVTNQRGIASCQITEPIMVAIFDSTYTASFAGNSTYLPSTAKGVVSFLSL